MKLKTLTAAALATASFALAPVAQAQWSTSILDMGVEYTLTDHGGSTSMHTFSLVLNTTGYNHVANPATAYLDSVDIKAWSGSDISFILGSAPGATSWSDTFGPISSGPVGNTGCGGSGAGFACVEATDKGVLSVVDGNPYTFEFAVTLNSGSFLTSATGAHIGAGYASVTGEGSSYGITSREIASPIPEPETYAMLLAGLGLLGWHARRRKQREARVSA